MLAKIYVDGASRGNPGASAIGVQICDAQGQEMKTYHEYLGNSTNNIAEYTAILRALELAEKEGIKEIQFFSDSMLCVRQLRREWKIKTPHIRELFERVKIAEMKFKKVNYTHIPREQNKVADALANKALDEL